jgi:magnesium-protoporphyrin O-methyltransferase
MGAVYVRVDRRAAPASVRREPSGPLRLGGGVGQVQIELLRRGAARTVNLELSPAYDVEAARLLREAGLEGRAERLLHDIAVDPDAVEPADVVVLNRVVCCYPDYERLLGAAADRARRLLVFSHPPRNAGSRAVVALQNAAFRLARKEFRTFAHPPQAMLDVCRARGLQPAYAHAGLVWQVDGLVAQTTTSTSQGARRTTFSDVEPSSARVT